MPSRTASVYHRNHRGLGEEHTHDDMAGDVHAHGALEYGMMTGAGIDIIMSNEGVVVHTITE